MDLTRWELEQLRKLISDVSGLHFDASKSEVLEDALKERLEFTQLRDATQYYEYLNSDSDGPTELRSLLSLITVNETHFFRHADHFTALKECIFPELVNRKLEAADSRSLKISIWSAGCSSGDEPYSVAISARGVLESYPLCKVEILGTDIDDMVLARARKASFSRKSVQDIDGACMGRYFKEVANEFILNDETKKMVTFEQHNLCSLPYPAPSSGKWDIIFCRNVIIYFSKKAVRCVIDNFFKSLADGGYLVLGYSESLQGISSDYSLVRIGNAFVYRKERYKKEYVEPLLPPQQSIDAGKPDAEDAPLVLYNAAFKCFMEKDFDSAMATVSLFLGKRPEDAKGHLLAGRIYLEKGMLEEAAAEIKRTIEIEPLLASAYYFLGVTHETQKMICEATVQFKKALYLDQEFILARFSLASIYRASGNTVSALREYSNALKCLERMPPSEPLEYANAFTAKMLKEACRRNIQRLRARIYQA